MAGRIVRVLADRQFSAGQHSLVWGGLDDGRERLPHGVYFARLRYRASGFADSKRVIVLR